MDDVGYPIQYQIFITIISFINIWMFSLISYRVITQILIHSDKENKLKKLRTYEPLLISTTFLWVSIIFRAILKALMLNNLIIPYADECIVNKSCLQCDVIGRIEICSTSFHVICKLTTFLIVLKENFQKLEGKSFICKMAPEKLYL